MKKYVLLCLMAGLNLSLMAEDYENYKLNISGEIETTIKSQDKFKTPFDYPDWAWSTRGGASDRDSQFARVQGNVNFSSGTLGMSEYFGVLSLNVDPQNTNDNTDYREGQLSEKIWNQSEKNKVELTNAFVMWRPWAVKDKNGKLIGRPFGVTVGNQSIPNTINALNTNVFKGDIDGDFIAYTTTSLMNKPGINLDFHTGKFGVGYAYLKGSSDLLNNSSGFTNERSKTQVVYADADMMGIKANAAYQMSEGNRKTQDSLGDYSSLTGTGSGVKGYFKDGSNKIASIDFNDYDYKGTALNVSVAYGMKFGDTLKVTPFVGYQKTETEVAPDIIVETANKLYNSNFNIQKVEAQFVTLGGKVETKLFGKNIKISGEHSVLDSPEAKGIDLVYDGQIDYAYANSTGNINGALTTLAPGVSVNSYKMQTASFKGIAGNGKATYTIAGLESMSQVDVTVQMRENVDVTFFYKQSKAKKVNYEVTQEQKDKMAAVIKDELLVDHDGNTSTAPISLSAVSDATATAVANSVAESMATVLQAGLESSTKWEDSNSVGMSVTYKF